VRQRHRHRRLRHEHERRRQHDLELDFDLSDDDHFDVQRVDVWSLLEVRLPVGSSDGRRFVHLLRPIVLLRSVRRRRADHDRDLRGRRVVARDRELHVGALRHDRVHAGFRLPSPHRRASHEHAREVHPGPVRHEPAVVLVRDERLPYGLHRDVLGVGRRPLLRLPSVSVAPSVAHLRRATV
jgi:hypothetical protein